MHLGSFSGLAERLILQVGRAALAECDNLLIGRNLCTLHHHFILEFMRNEFETAVVKFARIFEEILPVLEETSNPVVQVLMEFGNLGASWVSVESILASIGNEFGTAFELHVETSPRL